MLRDSCLWYVAGPKTFRLASRQIMPKKQEHNGKFKKVGFGGNLQNIEKGMREIYIPDEGKIFVQTDQGGAEALIMSYDCEPGDYRQLFIHNVKPHVFVALHLFKDIWPKKMREHSMLGDIKLDMDAVLSTRISELKSIPYWRDLDLLIKDSDNWDVSQRYYYFAKQTCHSANYNIQKDTFRMNILDKSGGKIVIPPDEAERFLLVYRALFPEIPERNRRVRRQAEQTKMLFNMYGHPYHISQYWPSESNYKEYYSWCPQSTVGMITNIAFANMQSFIEDNNLDWDILINGHDSIVSQCPVAEVLDCAKKQKEFIEQSFESTLDHVPFKMKSDSMAGFNWAPKKEKIIDGKVVVFNPQGLVEVKGL